MHSSQVRLYMLLVTPDFAVGSIFPWPCGGPGSSWAAAGQNFALRDEALILLSRAALPATSRISAVRYSSTNGRQVHRGAGVQAFRVVAPAEEPAHEAHREMQISREERVLAL